MSIRYVGIDIFAGAGGMSVGAEAAGIEIVAAVEVDKQAAITYSYNHPNTHLINDDIRKVSLKNSFKNSKDIKILFGGPPCQGFSTSNQKTRNKDNSTNWLFEEYLRIAKEVRPDWVIVENVKGIIETEGGYFFEQINHRLQKLGYATESAVLNATDFGVPQTRNRVFIVGSLHGTKYIFPKAQKKSPVTVWEAISDLPSLSNGANICELSYRTSSQNGYQTLARRKSKYLVNNLVTKNANFVIERYKHIPQGGNWQNIPSSLMKNYKDFTRCHTGIYHRLNADAPSVVIGNYRKNMLIHPHEDRGLSVREAARIQSFPDTFRFYGSIGFQQQQVGNSVPPLLAKKVFEQILK